MKFDLPDPFGPITTLTEAAMEIAGVAEEVADSLAALQWRSCHGGLVMADKYADVTGRLHALLPEGPERDELLGIARLGVKMKRQHVGKRPEFIQNYFRSIVERLAVRLERKPTFYDFMSSSMRLSWRRQTLEVWTAASPVLLIM